MAVDDTKISYSNTWDIDQQITSSTVAVGAGDTAVLTVPGVNAIPVTEVQFQPTGSTKWFQPGVNSTANTLATNFTWYSYLTGGILRVSTTIAGTVRYYIYADKMDY